jgi:uncharacterized protein
MVAVINNRDTDHVRCVATMEALPPLALVTTWACLAEAMYLLGKWGGIRSQDALWEFVAKQLVTLHTPGQGEAQRMRILMNSYADAPMDFADSSLVAAAEVLNQRRIFTTDKHFYAYRDWQGNAFEVIP